MKVLLLGTSHTIAFRLGMSDIEAQFPSLDISSFCLPGRAFAEATLESTVFKAAPDAHDVSLEWNAATEIDLASFDHILHIGNRFIGMPYIQVLAKYDILEEPLRRLKPLLSRAALDALMQVAISRCVQDEVARFGADPRITFIPGPHPLVRSWKPGPGHDYALAAVSKRPDVDEKITWYEDCVEEAVSKTGMRYMRQPMETRHDIARTKNKYARANSGQEQAGDRTDNRHTNGAFGAVVFAQFAQNVLGLNPLHPHPPTVS